MKKLVTLDKFCSKFLQVWTYPKLISTLRKSFSHVSYNLNLHQNGRNVPLDSNCGLIRRLQILRLLIPLFTGTIRSLNCVFNNYN